MDKQKTTGSREKKSQELAALKDKLARAKTIAFVDYHGLSVNQISQLRGKIKETGGQLIVAKNTLISRALLSTNHQLPTTDYQLAGPSAVIFAYEDEISPIKAAFESNQIFSSPKFKFGFLGKNFLDNLALVVLAKIPSKVVLQNKLVTSLASPIYGLVSVLQANIRNLLSVLDQTAKSRA